MSSPITAPKCQPLAESSGIILGRNCKSAGCVLIQPKLLDSSRLAPGSPPDPLNQCGDPVRFHRSSPDCQLVLSTHCNLAKPAARLACDTLLPASPGCPPRPLVSWGAWLVHSA